MTLDNCTSQERAYDDLMNGRVYFPQPQPVAEDEPENTDLII
jgi:hypothetical protein